MSRNTHLLLRTQRDKLLFCFCLIPWYLVTFSYFFNFCIPGFWGKKSLGVFYPRRYISLFSVMLIEEKWLLRNCCLCSPVFPGITFSLDNPAPCDFQGMFCFYAGHHLPFMYWNAKLVCDGQGGGLVTNLVQIERPQVFDGQPELGLFSFSGLMVITFHVAPPAGQKFLEVKPTVQTVMTWCWASEFSSSTIKS